MAASQGVGFVRTILPAAVGAFGAGMFTADTLNKREPALTAEGIKNAVAEAMKDVIPDVEKAVEAVEEAIEKAFGEEFEKALVDAVKKGFREAHEESENAAGVNEAMEKANKDLVKDV